MKKLLAFAIIFSLISFPAAALINIPASNNVHTFEAMQFEPAGGFYAGGLFVGWDGNGNNDIELSWTGNEGELKMEYYYIADNQQTDGIIGVSIEQTENEQTVVFFITKVNGEILTATVIAPALLINQEDDSEEDSSENEDEKDDGENDNEEIEEDGNEDNNEESEDNGEIEEADLILYIDKNEVRANDSFRLTPFFERTVNSNAAVLEIEYNSVDIEYTGFIAAEGVTVLNTIFTENSVIMTFMILDYNTRTYGDFLFSVKEPINIIYKESIISVNASIALKDEYSNEKILFETSASGSIIITGAIPAEITLLELSSLIDAFGITSGHEDWSKYRIFDINNDGAIDIIDIIYFARLIK